MDLSQAQAKNAQAVVAAGRSMGMSTRDIQIGLMTALTESSLQMYANSSVPESLSYPHDAVGSDTDSLGIFQQRPSAGWGTVKQLMNAQYDAEKFFSVLKTKGNRITETPWLAAQSVQISAYSDGSNYEVNWVSAQELYNEVTGGKLPITKGSTSDGNPIGDAIGAAIKNSPIGWAASLSAILGDFDNADWWKRVGKFALGGAFLLVAALVILHESGAVSATVNTGKKVAEGAAILAA